MKINDRYQDIKYYSFNNSKCNKIATNIAYVNENDF